MAQDDFDSLFIAGEANSSMLDAMPQVNSAHSDGKIGMEVDNYVPVNLLPEEVRAMIKAWELEREKMEVSATDAPALEDYEPLRTCSQTAPPKRFFRTFWRSVTRRLLENDEKAVKAFGGVSTY